jgi:hypothetical protein
LQLILLPINVEVQLKYAWYANLLWIVSLFFFFCGKYLLWIVEDRLCELDGIQSTFVLFMNMVKRKVFDFYVVIISEKRNRKNFNLQLSFKIAPWATSFCDCMSWIYYTEKVSKFSEQPNTKPKTSIVNTNYLSLWHGSISDWIVQDKSLFFSLNRMDG